MTGSIRLSINFSKILENSGRRLIGLYESGGFPGLRIIMIIENFHTVGKYVSLIIELKIWVRDRMAFLGSWEATSAVMRSYPGVFCLAEFLIRCWISLGRMCLGGRVMGSGEINEFSISSILVGESII